MSEKKRHPMLTEDSEGFGMIEVLVAVFVIAVALVGLLALFSHSIATMSLMEDLLIAKQKAREVLESIYTARNTQQLSFAMIQNVSDAGIFMDGYQPLQRPNPTGAPGDGLVGTADDGPVETLVLPGPDGEVGTGDDELRVLDSFERQILIQPVLYPDNTVNPDIRKVVVSIRYNSPMGGQNTFEVQSYVSRFR